jgi:hypothetical protein
VIKAGQAALEAGNVNLVLIWVKKDDEAAIDKAFKQALAVLRQCPLRCIYISAEKVRTQSARVEGRFCIPQWLGSSPPSIVGITSMTVQARVLVW